jgi:hypothetical protein
MVQAPDVDVVQSDRLPHLLRQQRLEELFGQLICNIGLRRIFGVVELPEDRHTVLGPVA